MICLAYDGSLNGDWIARYALRFALHGGKALRVLHVREAQHPEAEIRASCERLQDDAGRLGVDLQLELLPPAKSVLHTLLAALPAGPGHLVVCGTRARSRQSAYLAGTIAEKLLHGHRCAALALRVVQPGLLGVPCDLLLPWHGHEHGIEPLLPFLHLLAPDVKRLELLRGSIVSRLRQRQLSNTQRGLLRSEGERMLATLRGHLDALPFAAGVRIDGHTTICSDWEEEIALQASRLHCRLIVVGARTRSLPHRLMLRNPLEQLLRHAPCDVAVYRAP